MPIDESRLPLVLPASVARVQDDGRPTKPLIDNEFATREWYLQNAVDLDQKITDVQSQTDDALASVHTEILAVTSATEAFAADIETVQTSLAGNTATLNTVAASVNGLAVKYGVTGTINGVTGGFIFQGVLKNDGTVSYDMEFNSNVTINGNVVINGTVTTPKVAASNINSLTTGTLTGRIGVTANNTWTDIVAFAVPGGDGAYAFVTLVMSGGIYVPGTGNASTIFYRIVSDTYGDVSYGGGSPNAGVVDAAGNGAYVPTAFSLVMPATTNNDVIRLQVQNVLSAGAGRTFFAQPPTYVYYELRKR